MHLLEQFPQLTLEFLIFCALIEFADEMSTGLQGVETELQRRTTQILPSGQQEV